MNENKLKIFTTFNYLPFKIISDCIPEKEKYISLKKSKIQTISVQNQCSYIKAVPFLGKTVDVNFNKKSSLTTKKSINYKNFPKLSNVLKGYIKDDIFYPSGRNIIITKNLYVPKNQKINFTKGQKVLFEKDTIIYSEGSIDFNYSEYAVVTETYPTDFVEDIQESFTTLIPSIRYVWDNALWSGNYPNDGMRTYLRYRMSPKINHRSLVFHRITADVRKYYPISNGISFATRFFTGTNWGRNAQKFRMGGVPWLFSIDKDRIRSNEDLSIEELYFSEYLTPLRGSQISQLIGKNTFLFNAELRLPFLLYYFPAIKWVGQINGIIFADIGVTWDNSQSLPDITKQSNWVERTPENGQHHGWVMSYGWGPRFILFGLPLQINYAWQFNPLTKQKSEKRYEITIGFDL